VPTFNYYLTQCYQHIYLATSTLWENKVFDTDITHSVELATFRSVLHNAIETTLELETIYYIERLSLEIYNNHKVIMNASIQLQHKLLSNLKICVIVSVNYL